MPSPTPMPPTSDEDGANLDPRQCDCGKGKACPLVTPAWDLFLQDTGVDLDAWLPSWGRVPRFGVVDLRDGFVMTHDAEDRPFLTKERAETFARSRNEGLFVAAQTFRVVKIDAVAFADVKPRTGALAGS